MKYADFLSRIDDRSSLGSEIAKQTNEIISVSSQPIFISKETTTNTRHEGMFYATTNTLFVHGEYLLDSGAVGFDRYSMQCLQISEFNDVLLNLIDAQNFNFRTVQHVFRSGAISFEINTQDKWEQTPQEVVTFVTTLRTKVLSTC